MDTQKWCLENCDMATPFKYRWGNTNGLITGCGWRWKTLKSISGGVSPPSLEKYSITIGEFLHVKNSKIFEPPPRPRSSVSYQNYTLVCGKGGVGGAESRWTHPKWHTFYHILPSCAPHEKIFIFTFQTFLLKPLKTICVHMLTTIFDQVHLPPSKRTWRESFLIPFPSDKPVERGDSISDFWNHQVVFHPKIFLSWLTWFSGASWDHSLLAKAIRSSSSSVCGIWRDESVGSFLGKNVATPKKNIFQVPNCQTVNFR